VCEFIANHNLKLLIKVINQTDDVCYYYYYNYYYTSSSSS